MRIQRIALLIGLVANLAACQTAAGPERRDLLGSWTSEGFPNVVVRMTIAETARSVEGAGSWAAATTADAFRVSGVLATDEVALHFAFTGRPSLSFQGFFSDEDTIEGTISGGEYRLAPMRFERVDLLP